MRLAEDMADIERSAWDEVWLYADDCSEIIRNMPNYRRKRVAVALISEMLDDQGGICPLCEKLIDQSTLSAFHVDHIIPFVYGGGCERNNLQVTHPLCNLRKGSSISLYELVPYLERKAGEVG